MKRRVCMTGLLGVAVALIGLTVNADEPAKSCPIKSASAATDADGECEAKKSECTEHEGCDSETAHKHASLTKEEAAEAAKNPKVICPVSGKPVKKAIAVDYQGAKVSLCCNGCKGKFEKDTPKYAAKANYQLVATGQAEQKACPFSGRKLNPESYAKVGDVNVGHCADGCKNHVANAKLEDQIQLVFSQAAFEKGFVIKKKEAKIAQK